MKNNPLAIVCVFFCLGIWTAKFVHIPLFFLYVSCVLFLLTALTSFKKQFLFSLSLGIAIFLAGFLHLTNAQTYPPNHISNFVSGNPQKVYVRGKVVTNPEVSRAFYHSKKTTFTFSACDLKSEKDWQAVEGLIKATLYGERGVGYGDELLLQGTLARPPGLRNPGGFNYRAYLANHNVFGTLKVKEKDAFLPLRGGLSPVIARRSDATFIPTKQSQRLRLRSNARNDGFLRAIFKFKQKLHRIIHTHLELEQAALLSAILLGERSNLSREARDLFTNTGTIHILAISGLHIGLIAFILVALFRFLRFPRRLTFIFSIFLLISYAALSGARPSVVRAAIMAVTILFGFLINREIKIYNSLGFAALLILIFHPHNLFDAGFQLSFLSVISIVYFAPKIEKLFPARRGVFFYLIRAFSVSLSAWIGIAPLVAFYFNIVTPVAVLANLVVIPCLFLIVSAGISFLIFACLWAPLGAIFAETCWLSLLGLTALTSFIAKIPWGFFHCSRPGIIFFCAYYALLLLSFNYKKLNISPAKAGIALLLAANFLVWKPLFKTPSGELKVTFLDVGLGDAIFIEFPYSGGTLLIDGGDAGEVDAGRWAILPFLWNKGIDKIDAVLLTHPDNDHVGGLAGVLKNVKVNYVFDNGMPKESTAYNNYKTQIEEKASHYRAIKQGEKILGFPQVELFVIYPQRTFLVGTGADANNNSVVLKLAYKDVSFIFCADIQNEAIKKLLPYSSMLESTVIKIPHHGSDEGEAEDYLFQAVSAQLAVISVDRNNRFGFPAPEVMERLRKTGAKVYTTGDNGAVIISTDGKDIRVKTMAKKLAVSQ